MEGPNAVLNVMTVPPGATKTQARLVLDGVRGSIFVYKAGGPLGALIGSWAGTAGTDPYGNVYPAGLSVGIGGIIGTGTGDEILFYSTNPPAQDKLIFSLNSSPTTTTDAVGNTVLPGLTFYTGTSGAWTAMSYASGQIVAWNSTNTHQTAWVQNVTYVLSNNATPNTFSIQTVGQTKIPFLTAPTGAAPQSGLSIQSGATLNGEYFDQWFTLTQQGSAPATPAAGLVRGYFDSNGLFNLKLPSGNTTAMDQVTQTSGTQTFTLASAVAITGLSAALAVGTYDVEFECYWVPTGVIGSNHTHAFAFTGAASSAQFNGTSWQAQTANGVSQNTNFVSSTVFPVTWGNSPVHVAFNGWTRITCRLVVTTAGTLTPTIALVTAGDNVITQAGCRMVARRVA